ncbi:MAG: DRTGG domain-containing protein [Christensenellales bacterium]|jgi:predicted transcriptional regulator
MKVSEVAACLSCDIICGEQNMDKQLTSAFGADLMSDVLSFAKEGCVLLTGMVNQHTIRTAEMLDVLCIVFVRGKKPTSDICELAKKKGMTLLVCKHTLYEACGRLYQMGLAPCCKE